MVLDSRVHPPASARRPAISVIICAWNEQDTLADCLRSVLAQARAPDEIIVVDNASTDRTGDVARRFAGVRVIEESRKGLTRARDAGHRASTGDILACLDADCRAPAGWLAGIERQLADPRVVAVTGPFRFYDWTRTGCLVLRAYDAVIEFHGEDANLGRRLHRVGRVVLSRRCVMFTSARRYTAMGTLAVLRLYARNFCHEVLWHQPADTEHLDVRT
ncbi:glycosyltransferase [Luteitalea sp.]|uniref:glycosyltransferase n=1 Tax=Luteitalea sp. TaxID=2004800 RepID=UPI0025BC4480|nr:glycosyltransferase [Luteitalea sp.]